MKISSPLLCENNNYLIYVVNSSIGYNVFRNPQIQQKWQNTLIKNQFQVCLLEYNNAADLEYTSVCVDFYSFQIQRANYTLIFLIPIGSLPKNCNAWLLKIMLYKEERKWFTLLKPGCNIIKYYGIKWLSNIEYILLFH